jgi:hypothetical protein
MRRSLQTGPICVMPRALSPAVTRALDALPAERLPRLRFKGSPEDVRAPLLAAIVEVGFGPSWLASWFAEDVSRQAALFVEIAGVETVSLRLDVLADDACRKFHVDEVRLRLLTTYRGPGTEWLSPRMLALLKPNEPLPAESVNRLAPGDLAILRGGKSAKPDEPGLLHRSPPIAGTGVVRLLLAINEAEA